MPYFKLIILAVTAVNYIAAQSTKNGELQISDVNSESRKEEAENEIQKEINAHRKFMQPKRYPGLVELQQNSEATLSPYNERKIPAAVPPPLLQLLYSHGTMKFPNKRTQHIPPAFPPLASFSNPQQPNTVAGFVIAYSPTQTAWNSVPMPQEQIADERLDPLAVEESQVFIEIAQPQSGPQPKSKLLQYLEPVGGHLQIDSDSADVEEQVQYTTSTNSAKAMSKTNRLGDLTNSELQQTAGVQQQPAVVDNVGTLQQQQPAVVDNVGTLQQQPRAVGNRVGSLQQQPNVGAVQRPQVAVGNRVGSLQQQPNIGAVQRPQVAVGRSGTVAQHPQHPQYPQHPPVASGFPTFSISFDPLNFLLSLLHLIPIPKLNLDGRTFFGIELKKGFNFPPEAPSHSRVQIGQQQPFRRGTTIHFG